MDSIGISKSFEELSYVGLDSKDASDVDTSIQGYLGRYLLREVLRQVST